MRVNVVSIAYRDGYVVENYDMEEILREVNRYNSLKYPKSKMTITKLRRYLLGKSNIPSPYKSISKTRLNELLNIKNLSQTNYGEVYNDFVRVNGFATRTLHIPNGTLRI
jgi:hypothetical protein